MNVAILIASENYADPDEKLTAPGKDIELLEKKLKEYCNYDIYISLWIKDGEPQSGAEQNIEQIFTQLASEDIETILFYFSGHGSYDAGSDSFLCLNDIEYLGIKRVAGWINSLSPQKSYIIVDACEAGDEIIIEYDGFADDDSQAFFGIFASTPTTSAFAYPNSSLFTNAFCEALEDYSLYTNNELSINRIYEYIHHIFQIKGIAQRISFQGVQKDVQPFAVWRKALPHCQAPFVDPLYIERSDETYLIDKLLNEKTLLLCGETKVGKTYLSLSLAKKLWRLGYDFLQTNNLDTARNFLSLTDHPRICLLDDPYGSWKTFTDSDRHKAVSDIISNKPVTNLLIISSRKDIILDIFGRRDLTNCKESAFNWNEILSEKEVLLQAWDYYSSQKSLSSETIMEYTNYLSSPRNILTIGNLKTIISTMSKDDIEQKALQDIVHLSQIDASEQAGKYLNTKPEIWDICSILALTCNTIDHVTYKDIGFILHNEIKYPSIEEREKVNLRASRLFHETRMPEYENPIEIEEKINNQILWLEQQNVIHISDERIRFTHPYHQEVCIYIMSNLNDRRRKVLIRNLYNSLNCLNPDAAYICSQNIRYIEQPDDSLSQAIIDIPMSYLYKPLFPKVRDSVLQYFIEGKLSMSSKEINEFAELIANGSTLYVYWNGEIPYYDEYSFKHELVKEKLTSEEYLHGIDIINTKAYISPRFLYLLLFHHKDNEVNFEQGLFEKGICAEEEFLRSTAVEYLFDYQNKIENRHLLSLLINNKKFLLPDTYYTVVELGINNFHKVDNLSKTEFKGFISDIFRDRSNCLRCARLMLHFSIDYGSVDIHWKDFTDEQKLELWILWKDIFPIYLSNMDPKIASYLMSGRYSQTLMDFAKIVSPKEFITLFRSILHFYKLQINFDSFEMEDQLFAISLAFDVTRDTPKERGNIFSEILKIENKYSTNYLISICVANWNYLRDDEKEEIKTQLNVDNKLVALALFCPDCPSELLILITNNDLLNFSDIQGVLATFSPELLNCCIDVFTEKIILTNYYRDCYERNTFAAKVLLYLLENENERLYDISSALLSNNLMTPELWLKVSSTTQLQNELARSLSDLFDLGYSIKHYDEYWIFLFTRFLGENESDVFAEYFFYAFIRLKKKFPQTNQDDLKRLFPPIVMTYFDTEYYRRIVKNIIDKVEAENRVKFEL